MWNTTDIIQDLEETLDKLKINASMLEKVTQLPDEFHQEISALRKMLSSHLSHLVELKKHHSIELNSDQQYLVEKIAYQNDIDHTVLIEVKRCFFSAKSPKKTISIPSMY